MKLLASSRVPEPEKHHYVRLIEYSLANPSFSPNDACLACDLNARDFRFIAPTIYVLNARQDREMNLGEHQDWVLSPQAYFSYLQYLEFLHAIEAAKRAFFWAAVAVVVSIIGVAISIS